NVHPQSDDDVLGHALRQMARDVRERDEQVRRSEAHFRSLIENASDVITVIDTDGKILYESPSVERVLGYRAEELVGRDFYTLVHPDDTAAVRAVFERVPATPGQPQSIEFRCRNQDDAWRIVEGFGTYALDQTGHPTIIVNSRDVTIRREAQD